jgi:hypothetical protein
MTISQQMRKWQAIAEQDKIRFKHLWQPENTPAPNTPAQPSLFPIQDAEVRP